MTGQLKSPAERKQDNQGKYRWGRYVGARAHDSLIFRLLKRRGSFKNKELEVGVY